MDDAAQIGGAGLLGPVEIRTLAEALGVRPTKVLGQNFVHDAGTVRRIVREAGVREGDAVLEVGPGLGSLTLALLEAGAMVSAVEIDERLAAQLPHTVAQRMPEAAGRFALVCRDALEVDGPAALACPPAAAQAQAGADASGAESGFAPTRLVANLPYNVAVPVILTLLEVLPSLRTVTVMVQTEVAERLAAGPGSRTYGVPSVKAAWYGTAKLGSKVSRNVFWPEPNVDSSLVHLVRYGCEAEAAEGAALPEAGEGAETLAQAAREDVFAVVDAAFAQRRKTLRAALGSWAGSPARAEEILRAAGIDPKLRGERLAIEDFAAIAQAGAGLAGQEPA